MHDDRAEAFTAAAGNSTPASLPKPCWLAWYGPHPALSASRTCIASTRGPLPCAAEVATARRNRRVLSFPSPALWFCVLRSRRGTRSTTGSRVCCTLIGLHIVPLESNEQSEMMITRHGSAVCRSSVRLMGSSQPVRSRDGTDKGATRQVASPWGQEEKNSERKKCRLLTCSILLLVLLTER